MEKTPQKTLAWMRGTHAACRRVVAKETPNQDPLAAAAIDADAAVFVAVEVMDVFRWQLDALPRDRGWRCVDAVLGVDWMLLQLLLPLLR